MGSSLPEVTTYIRVSAKGWSAWWQTMMGGYFFSRLAESVAAAALLRALWPMIIWFGLSNKGGEAEYFTHRPPNELAYGKMKTTQQHQWLQLSYQQGSCLSSNVAMLLRFYHCSAEDLHVIKVLLQRYVLLYIVGIDGKTFVKRLDRFKCFP